MIRLYHQPLSPYAQKVKIALREKGVPFETGLPGGLAPYLNGPAGHGRGASQSSRLADWLAGLRMTSTTRTTGRKTR